MKTIKHWLLTIATLLCSTSIQAYDFMVDGIYYNILSAADKTVEVTMGETSGIENTGTISYDKETFIVPSKVTFNNIEFTVLKIGDWAFSYCGKLQNVKLPSTIKTIGNEAFGQCYNLKEVDLPSRLTSIGDYAFYGCTGLTSIVIPNSVNSIGEYAFAYCSKLQVKLPDYVSIENEAFVGIKCIMLPSGPPSLSGTPFDRNSLLLIKYELHDMGEGFGEMYGEENRIMNAESYYLYYGSFSSSEYAYDYYDNLMMYDSTFTEEDFSILYETGGYVTVDGVTYVVKELVSDYRPFTMEVVGGRNIKDANILSKVSYLNREFTVTSIREEAFANVSTLESVSIPSTIKSIGSNAFAGCTGIKNVTVASESPLNINEGCFDAMTQLFATLYVPTGCVSAYKNANVWKGFGTITESTVTHVALTLKAGEGGTLKCGETSVTDDLVITNVAKGETTISVVPKSNYVIKSITVDGKDVSSQMTNGELTIEITADTKVEASFRIVGFADYDFEVDGIYYEKRLEGLYVVDGGQKYSGDIVIPETVTYDGVQYDVTMIDYSAFKNCTGLTSVIISKNVKEVGLFRGCTGLTSVTVHGCVDLDINSFVNCNNLTSITFTNPNPFSNVHQNSFEYTGWYQNQPDGLLYIGNWLVGYKGTMPENTRVEIKEGTLGIAGGVFSKQVNLKSVILPETVKNICNYAFYGCSGLTSVTIPNSVEVIGDRAFQDCENLDTINILSTNNIKSIGENVFDGTAWYSNKSDGLVYLSDWLLRFKGEMTFSQSLAIKQGTVGIADGAFKNIQSLSNIVILEGIESIGTYAFYGCNNLKEITLPTTLEKIGGSAFSGTSINKCNISSLEAWCSIDFGDQASNPLINGNEGLYLNGILLNEVVIPSSVTEIKPYAFWGHKSITSVTIPEGVTSIGHYAFAACFKLASVNIPNSVKYIGHGAFAATVIKSVVIPKNTIVLYLNPFCANPMLTSVVVEEGNPVYDSRNNCNAIIHTRSNSLIAGSNLTVIPKDVVSIGVYAFDTRQFTSIKIPNSIKYIDDFAFNNCNNLVSIELPNSLIKIGNNVFSNCSKLTSLTIPENVELIGSFGSPSYLKSITCKAVVPPVYEHGGNGTLYVPYNALDDYKSHEHWSKFTKIEAISTEVNLLDNGESYELESAVPCQKLNYTRTFNNTEWQALYVPFAMNYENWKDSFDVAKINNVHQFDEDDDDVFDRTVLEVIKVKSGTLKPNHPYMIRAKSTGTKTITVENATLMPAEENSIDCSSVEREYVFTGTYTGVDGETMVENMYYGMCGGELKYATNIDTSLKPLRWYMQIMDRDGQVINDIAEAKVIVRGEEDWDITDIEDVKTESGKFVIYSIGGTLVRNVKADNINQATEGLSAGMYIINGKKHFIK